MKALDAMRQAMIAAGVTGRDLRAVTEQYWVAHAAQSAGIDLDQWDPSFDAEGNQDTIVKVYEYYGELYKKDPNMKWAGLANIVGPDTLLAMQKHNFMDLGSQHEAFATQGMQAIKQMRDAGTIDEPMLKAWTAVDRGTPAEVVLSARAFADREQNHVIADQYQQMYDHDGIVGEMARWRPT